MKNLFVTFPMQPKNALRLDPSIEHYRKNVDGHDYFVFKVGNSLPARAKEGARCYIGFGNRVHGHMIFKKAAKVPAEEAAQFGDWDGSGGNFLFCDFDSFTELKEKPEYTAGFPGFRYYEDEIAMGRVILPSSHSIARQENDIDHQHGR